MTVSLKSIVKGMLYTLFLAGAFFAAWFVGGSRDGRLFDGQTISSTPQAHADAPAGSSGGSAGCAGSGDGSSGDSGEGEGGSDGGGSDGSGGEGGGGDGD